MDAAVYINEIPRVEQEKRGKIRTFTGKLVDPLNLQPSDIDIEDIAHALSNLCRYTGHVPVFYSVAQHSVLVARYFMTSEMRLAGLLHDAAEAYINDMASPIKRAFGMERYVQADERGTAAVLSAFGLKLSTEQWAEIKRFDDLVFRREVASFWPTKFVPDDQYISPWSSGKAKREFLALFNEQPRASL